MYTVEEIKKYMKLSLEKNERECLKLLNKKRKGDSLKCRLFIYTLANFFLVNDCYFQTDLTAFVRNSQSDCPMSARPAPQHDNHQLPIRYCTCCK